MMSWNWSKKLLSSGMRVVMVSYIIICGLLYMWQEKLIFYPEVLPPDFRYPFAEPFDELTWQVEGATINALHFKAGQPKGVILYFHGNGGSLRNWGEVAGTFVEQGYDVLMPDYRGYGKSTGRITGEAVLHQDAAYAYAYLQARYPEQDIILYGRSLGTGLAVYLARSYRPRLLILESPYYSLRDLIARRLPFIPGFFAKYQLRSDLWIGEVTCPIYLFHGTQDEVIPYASGERLLTRIKAEHQLITIVGGGHNNLSDFPLYHEQLKAILN